jgi:hypothetical protein
LVPPYANRALGSCPEQLYELIGHKAGFEQLQSGLRNVHFGLALETGAIGPVDPRLPQAGQRAAKAGAWSRVLQASNVRSRRKLTCELLDPKLLQTRRLLRARCSGPRIWVVSIKLTTHVHQPEKTQEQI